MATLLTPRAAFHRAVLTETLVANDPLTSERVRSYTQRFVGNGEHARGCAKTRRSPLLDPMVKQPFAVLSFADTFWAVAALVLVSPPQVLLLGRSARGASVDMGH